MYSQPFFWEHVSNTSVREQTGLTTINQHLSQWRISLFGHVTQMDAEVPAKKALQLMVELADEVRLEDSWKSAWPPL